MYTDIKVVSFFEFLCWEYISWFLWGRVYAKHAIKWKRGKEAKALILYSGILMIFCQIIIQTHSQRRERQEIIHDSWLVTLIWTRVSLYIYIVVLDCHVALYKKYYLLSISHYTWTFCMFLILNLSWFNIGIFCAHFTS